ncbi:hypothetical protein KMW28_15455 [Flammeovirga yaeyamensis]|uniref:Ig-like domain-containing protein n=1 Tax=Flammeovirga yaeyamensis TaxID=367791 RepID=A0AAX1N0E8_9BACT|nr:hypothetical protein [Flammeovirga yaeyamensis]MBB3698591.1 hypothetical protein [Flammeovirga yaeyamensis]NMF34060.1 hypothetical protein [Flammeovirga yaeyamensis]QWG01048.1 hypothetical protein KMW28_15455 [Flammeovirga yaeyamensis]
MSTKIHIVLLSTFLLLSNICLSQNPLDRTRIIFKSGKYTNSTSIKIELHGTGVTHVMASGDASFKNAHWVRFQPVFNYNLSANDGVKSIYFKFKDIDGNESKTFMRKIILDTKPPEDVGVSIDVPSPYWTDTKSMKVGVILKAKGAKYYQLGNTSAFHGNKWRIFQDDYVEWDLAEGDDGIRKIYARYRDQAGNLSHVVSAEIMIDRTPPFAGSIKINGGAEMSNRQDHQVQLDILCRQADSMMVSQDQQFEEGKWEVFSEKKSIYLSDGDGTKRVYVKFKDKAGNETKSYSSSIELDTNAPKNIDFKINNGEKVTNDINKKVTLNIEPDDAALMMVSNSSSFNGGKWQQAVPSISWTLKGEEDGYKHVYIRFKDEAGNVSRPLRATIELKRGF